MTELKECLSNETLRLETTWQSPEHYGEQITIGYPENDKKEDYISIIVYSFNKEKQVGFSIMNFAQIFPNLEEVDWIIKGLQEARDIIKEKRNATKQE